MSSFKTIKESKSKPELHSSLSYMQKKIYSLVFQGFFFDVWEIDKKEYKSKHKFPQKRANKPLYTLIKMKSYIKEYV